MASEQLEAHPSAYLRLQARPPSKSFCLVLPICREIVARDVL